MTLHTRATSYTHGFLPEQLVSLAKEVHPRATLWEALPRSGRVGYKHCGLEVHLVNDGGAHTWEDVAGAVLAMVSQHHGATGCALYKINARDENGDLCGDGLALRMGEDGADEVPEVANGIPLWVIAYTKEIQAAHLATLKAVPDVMKIATDAMDALANAMGEVCAVRYEASGDDTAREAEAHKHERQMAFLSMFAPLLTADRARQQGRSPLADLLSTMPDEVKSALRECIGADFDTLCTAAADPNPETRREVIRAVIGGLSAHQKQMLSERIPPQWQTQISAAFRAEMAA